jgi:RNA polymerase sigma-70 factor (ECF subfamily)
MIRSEKEIEVIFKKYYPYMVLFSKKMVGNKEDAEDIILHVFSNAIPKFHKYESEDKIKALLFISAKNASLNHVIQRKVKVSNERKYGQLSPDIYEEYDGLESQLLMKIYEHASELPDQCQKIFYLSCCKGMRGKEIAAMLGISVHTVFSHRRLAIIFIKKHFQFYNQ